MDGCMSLARHVSVAHNTIKKAMVRSMNETMLSRKYANEFNTTVNCKDVVLSSPEKGNIPFARPIRLLYDIPQLSHLLKIN